MLDTVVFVDAKAVDFFTNEMVLVKINADIDSVTARGFHVMGYPTAVLIGADGEEIDRLIGFAETDEYLGTLRDYSNGIGTLADQLRTYEASPERGLAFEIADKYKYRGDSEPAMAWYEKVIEMGAPTDSLSGESRLAIADTHRRNKDYDLARSSFEQMMTDFAGLEMAVTAAIYVGVTLRQKGDTTAAIVAFQSFVEQYPDGDATEYAKSQIETLKGEGKEE